MLQSCKQNWQAEFKLANNKDPNTINDQLNDQAKMKQNTTICLTTGNILRKCSIATKWDLPTGVFTNQGFSLQIGPSTLR